jgi:hypothetical protein
MPTAATAIDASSERQKQTAGSRAPKAARAEAVGRAKILEHLQQKGLPVPARNEDGWLTLE